MYKLRVIGSSLFFVFLCLALQAQYSKERLKGVGTSDDFDNAEAVVVFDTSKVFMEESGLSRVQIHTLTKILTYSGAKTHSVVKVDYDPQSADVEINRVIVYRSNGVVEEIVKPVLDYAAPARMIYWGARQKMVEIGRLHPGEAVEVYITRKGFTYALLRDEDPESKYIPPMKGHFYDIVPFWSMIPVLEKTYSVNVLNTKSLQYKVYNGDLTITIEDVGEGRKCYSFKSQNNTAVKQESGSVSCSDTETKLLLSTAPNWQSKSQWFYGVNEDFGSFLATPELQKQVSKILKGVRTEQDSIEALTHWVADNMRYSGISMGKGEGYTLHNAEMNLRDRCGVCKDKAGLLVAMLRVAGFESYAAMTMAGERIEDIPADQFNHSVTVVKRRSGEYELLDPTWVPGVRELWSSAEQQQNYLMGLPQGAPLMVTPISVPEKHFLRITSQSVLRSNGTLEGEFVVTAEGQSDRAVRGVFAGRYSEWYNNVERELLRVAPNAIVNKIQYSDEEKYLEHNVKICFRYTIPQYAVVGGKEMLFTPLMAKDIFRRAMPHLNIDTEIEVRENAFKDRCSRLVIIDEMIQLPAYDQILFIPDSLSFISNYIKYRGSYSLKKRSLIFQELISLGKRVYEPEEWNDYRDAVDAQRYYSDMPIVIRLK